MSEKPRRSIRPLLLIAAIALPSLALGARGDDMLDDVRAFLSSGDDDDSARLVRSEPVRSSSEAIDFPRQAEPLRRALDADPPAGAAAELIERLGIVGDRSDVDRILPWSEHANPRVSAAAMSSLGRLGGSKAIDRLATMARSNDTNVNATATAALGLSSDPRAVDVLEEVSRHTDSWRRQSALDALALRGGARARRIIHRAFRNGPPAEAWSVANAVALLGEDVDRMLLAQTAVSNGDPRADAAMWALASLSGPEMDDLMIELAENTTGFRRGSVLGALVNVRDPRAVELLLAAWDEGQTHRYTVASTLGMSKAPGALDGLLDLLDRARPDQATWVVDALSYRPEQTAREVLALLATEDGVVAQHALSALARGVHPGTTELLIARFDESGRLPPPDTFHYLALHGGDEGWSMLEEALAEGTANDRNNVVWALQARGDEHAVDRLLDLARTSDSWTSSTAMGALEGMGEQARDGLKGLLLKQIEDGEGSFDQIAPTLARLGGDESRDLLIGRLSEGTDSERWSAMSALGQMDDPGARAAVESMLDSDEPGLRNQALQTLMWNGTGDLTPEVLDKALADEDPSVRATAVSALGTVATPESVERLFALVDDDDPMIRTSAISALATSGAPEAEEVLIAALDDPELSGSAMWGLQSLGTRDGAAAIRDLASTGDLDQRVAAIGMLGSDPSSEAGSILEERLTSDDFGEASSALWALQARGNTSAAEAIAGLIDGLDPDEDADLLMQAASSLQTMGGSIARDRAEQLQEILGYGSDGMLIDIQDTDCFGEGWEMDGGAFPGFHF